MGLRIFYWLKDQILFSIYWLQKTKDVGRYWWYRNLMSQHSFWFRIQNSLNMFSVTYFLAQTHQLKIPHRDKSQVQLNQNWDICSISFLNLTILWYVHRHFCMGVLDPPPYPTVRSTHEFLGTGSLYIKELWLFLFLLTITYWINSVYSNYIKPHVFPKGSLKKPPDFWTLSKRLKPPLIRTY